MSSSRPFQFTHPVRGATFGLGRSILLDKFQFTHPVRGATAYAILAGMTGYGFNSRTP